MIRDDDPSASVLSTCPMPQAPDFSGVIRVALDLHPPLADYLAAMRLAEAEKRLGDHMRLSWYDRDRDFESPQLPVEL